jgi:hypothetical protein
VHEAVIATLCDTRGSLATKSEIHCRCSSHGPDGCDPAQQLVDGILNQIGVLDELATLFRTLV